MARIELPSSGNSLGSLDIIQESFREQVDALAGMVRMAFGNGDIALDSASSALLSSRYTLYVNPDIGSDRYVAGVENPLSQPPLLKQQLVCGYTPFAPFKTIQRAFLEIARLSIIAGAANDEYDRFLVRVSTGTHIIENGLPTSAPAPWANDFTPTAADLRMFNSADGMGVIIPRGTSIIGEDLRKTVIRPADAPLSTGNPATGRGSIFKATGGAFFFNFTFKDQVGRSTSHHLLSAFEFCGSTELITYYDKVMTAFGVLGGEPMPGETEIGAPYPDGVPTPAVDTTTGSSAYIFNCSLRSDYGMCGIYLDGNKVDGFKSMVTAQFTNVSLQRDMNAWQVWSNGSWAVPNNYTAYISSNINNVRARIGGTWDSTTDTYSTDYRNFAFKCINNAVIQEVSCFVIGDAVHHWTASGGECTITNSNSNFGLTSLLSSGFRGVGSPGGAFPQDSGFLCSNVSRPLQIRQDGSNIRQLNLGTVKSYDHATGTLVLDAAVDPRGQLGEYTLRESDFVWVENRSRQTGPGFIAGNPDGSTAINARARLATTPWTSTAPDTIRVQVSSDLGTNNLNTISAAEIVGNRVFIRRLVDTRVPLEREYSLLVENSNILGSRRPTGNYVVRLSGRGTLAGQLDPTNGQGQLFLVDDSTVSDASPNAWRVLLRPGDSGTPYAVGTYYRPGQAIFAEGRVRRAKASGLWQAYRSEDWESSLSMLPSVRGIERGRSSVAPAIVVDKDQSNDPNSKTLGVDLSSDPEVLAQMRSTTDFEGVARFMLALGYADQEIGLTSPTLVGKILEPQATEATRLWRVDGAASPTPSGKLTGKAAWPLEFNRPSLVRAYGQAYEWAGQGNYSKALPKYQTTVLTDQHKIDFFGVGYLGGRVYNTGFNEDGLLVQGDTIKDLSTGRTVNTEVAGLGALSGDPNFENFPTSFDTLTVNTEFRSPGVSILNRVTINGVIDGGPSWAPGVLPIATTTAEGIVRLATNAEVEALADPSKAITPSSLAFIRNKPNGLAGLTNNGTLGEAQLPVIPESKLPVIPVNKLPTIPLEKWPIKPAVWVAGQDNLSKTSNFTFTYTGTSGVLALGAPIVQPSYVGSSGFIVISNSTTTAITGIDDVQWRATQNTWVDPQSSLAGLLGKLMLAFYVESQNSIIYNVSKVT